MVGATHAHTQDTSSGSTVATSIRTTGVHGSPIISSGRFLQLNCNSVVSSSVGTTPVIPPGSSAIVAFGQFQVKLLTASIKVCAGCRGGYERGPPPMDITLVRKERLQCYQSTTAVIWDNKRTLSCKHCMPTFETSIVRSQDC